MIVPTIAGLKKHYGLKFCELADRLRDRFPAMPSDNEFEIARLIFKDRKPTEDLWSIVVGYVLEHKTDYCELLDYSDDYEELRLAEMPKVEQILSQWCCAKDSELLEMVADRRRKHEALVDDFARRIREQFPSMPPTVEFKIARYSCEVGSGRIGRSQFVENSEYLAVVAHIRHSKTKYGELFDFGFDQDSARQSVEGKIKKIVAAWRVPS